MILFRFSREYWIIYRVSDFLMVLWFGCMLILFPSPSNNLDQRHTEKNEKRNKFTSCWHGDGGWRWARSQIIGPWECLILYKSFNEWHTVKTSQVADRKMGRVWANTRIIGLRESQILHKSFNTLCLHRIKTHKKFGSLYMYILKRGG
jgi:hypothetical protein